MLRPAPSSTFLLRFLALGLWMGVIFAFSSMWGSPHPIAPGSLYFAERKTAHVIEYFVLAILAFRFFVLLYPRETFGRKLMLAAAFSVAYAATDELHQVFTPFRGPSPHDIAIDAAGTALAAGLVLLWHLFSCRRRR